MRYLVAVAGTKWSWSGTDENVIQGSMTETLIISTATLSRLSLVDMLVLPIQHAIGVLARRTQVRRVLSKDQALKQCSAYLQEHYPQAQQVEIASTTAAMEMIVTERFSDAGRYRQPAGAPAVRPAHSGAGYWHVQRNKTRFCGPRRCWQRTTIGLPAAMPQRWSSIRIVTYWPPRRYSWRA